MADRGFESTIGNPQSRINQAIVNRRSSMQDSQIGFVAAPRDVRFPQGHRDRRDTAGRLAKAAGTYGSNEAIENLTRENLRRGVLAVECRLFIQIAIVQLGEYRPELFAR